MSVKDKVVIITGASSGIGQATAFLLAKNGAKLVLGARREEKLKDICKKINDDGGQAIYKVTDVVNYDDVKALSDLALSEYGKIDVLYNNAGIMPVSPLVEGRRDEWKQEIDININGVLNGIAAVLPYMQEHKSGHIIATDSVAGYNIWPNYAVYNGTKFAVRAIMEGLRQEQYKNNIKSTIVSPGSTVTNLLSSTGQSPVAQQMRKAIAASDQSSDWALRPEDIAQAVLFVIDTPNRMSVNDMIVRPTNQSV